MYLVGTLTSTPSSSFTLEFYSNAVADRSGYGQGQTFLGSTVVSTDATGVAQFNVSFPVAVAPGAFVTATATGSETSEFSAAVAVPPSQVLVFTVTTAADSGPGSLRAAIDSSNSHTGQNIIRFDLPDSNRVIEPLSPLPDITEPVIIDGTSQPGYAGLPLIEINGSQAGAAADGLVITGGGSVVRGLIINGFQGSWAFDGSDQGGNAIVLQGQGGNTIEDDFLGTDSTGTSAVPDGQAGVFVDNSPGNTIGGTTAAGATSSLPCSWRARAQRPMSS